MPLNIFDLLELWIWIVKPCVLLFNHKMFFLAYSSHSFKISLLLELAIILCIVWISDVINCQRKDYPLAWLSSNDINFSSFLSSWLRKLKLSIISIQTLTKWKRCLLNVYPKDIAILKIVCVQPINWRFIVISILLITCKCNLSRSQILFQTE